MAVAVTPEEMLERIDAIIDKEIEKRKKASESKGKRFDTKSQLAYKCAGYQEVIINLLKVSRETTLLNKFLVGKNN